MAHPFHDILIERISSGLMRKSVKTASRWAELYRVMGGQLPGKWSFDYYPWAREMHDSRAEINVGRKAAQVAFTETVLNVCFFNIDVRGIDCLYVLPSKTPDASDFSSSRFDAALELSPHLEKLFSDVKNVGHKRAGSANLYIRGSQSRSGLKSIPTGCVILDELDEMDQDNVPLAMERTAGQFEKLIWAISTPTTPMKGIDKMYHNSSMEHFFFKCPSCSKLTELVFPDCIEITADSVNDEKIYDSFLKCKECKAKLPAERELKKNWLASGRWVASTSNKYARGFYVNQLYSCTKQPVDIARKYLLSLADPTEEQEFYNSILGQPHIVKGAGVTDADLDGCTMGYRNGEIRHGLTTMGVDVGPRWIHYEVDLWRPSDSDTSSVDVNIGAKCRVLEAGKCLQFEELDALMHKYSIGHCIVDAFPERRKALEFAQRFPGRVQICFYGQGIQGRQFSTMKSGDEPAITVDRTSWLDLSLGRFRNRTITVPIDIGLEYREHLKNPVRRYERDKHNNPVGRYVNANDGDDHHAHARNYAELAFPFALGSGVHEDVESI